MRVLVDGHNALHALRIRGGDHEAQRHALLRRVRAAEPDATVFFDARDAPGHIGRTFREQGVRVIYCADREADEAILEQVRDARRARRLLVVSNDRELTGRAKQLGARAAGVAEFFGGGRAEPAGMPEDDVKPEGLAGQAFSPADFDLPDEVDLDDPRL